MEKTRFSRKFTRSPCLSLLRHRRCACDPCLLDDPSKKLGADCLLKKDVGEFKQMEVKWKNPTGMGQRTTRDQKNIRTAWVERIKKDMFVALERTDVDGPTKTAMPYKICEVIANKKSNGQDKDFENNKIKRNKSFVVVKVYVVKNEEQHSFRPNGETTNYTFDDLWNTERIEMGPSSSSDGSTRCLSHDYLYALYHSH